MNDQLPDCTPSDPAMAERWRRTLDAMGIHVVRTRLAQSPGGSGANVGGSRLIFAGIVPNCARTAASLALPRSSTRACDAAFEALVTQIERIVHPVENVVAMTR